MKILIVDDNLNLAEVVKIILEQERHEVRLASDGMDGYRTYLIFQPDLIITDIQMPEKNGLELIREIRCHNPAVRTIYMSADLSQYWSPLEEERKKYHAGVLEKPFSKQELMHLLSSG